MRSGPRGQADWFGSTSKAMRSIRGSPVVSSASRRRSGAVWAGIKGGMLRVDPADRAHRRGDPARRGGWFVVQCQRGRRLGVAWLRPGPIPDRPDVQRHQRDVHRRRHQSKRHCRRRGCVGPRRDSIRTEWRRREDAFTTFERLDLETNHLVPDTKKAARAWSLGRWAADRWACRLAVDKLWGSSRRRKLFAFEPASGKVVTAFDISEGRGYGSNAIAFAYGSLWTASGTANAVRRFPRPIP